MSAGTTTDILESQMYCRGCDYDLRGLPEPRCPECGRPFDPASPKTFRLRPRRQRLRRYLRNACILVLILLIPAAPAAWIYHGWNLEQSTIRATARRPYRMLAARPLGGPSLRSDLGSLGKYLDRTTAIRGGGGTPMSLSDYTAIAQFHYLQELEICSPSVTDANIAPLAGLTDLTSLKLYYTHLTDSGILQLKTLHHLQILELTGGQYTGNTLGQLDLRELRQLRLYGEKVNDSALRTLANCTALEKLDLRDTGITDAGLPHLKPLKTLRNLDLSGTETTDPARAELRTALPDLTIIFKAR